MNTANSAQSAGTDSSQSTGYTMDELVQLIDGLHQAMEDLSSLLCLQKKQLNLLRIGMLEEDVFNLINEHYDAEKNRLEYEASFEILKQSGPVILIKKILWSDDLTDWCISVALDKLIPGLEILVEKYPDIVMNDAHSTTMKIFSAARQDSALQSER